jgi:maleylpyruvate isomerase
VTSESAPPGGDLEAVDASFVLVTGAVRGLTDADARSGSLLPGWTRGHVLTHLARNADGQRRMVEGVLRNEVVDQYPGGDEQRAADIESGAHRPVAELVADLHDSQEMLVAAWSLVPDGAWDRLTRARAGTRPVRDGVMSRRRELLVHLVDLDVGVTPAQLPADYLARDHDWLLQHRPTWS